MCLAVYKPKAVTIKQEYLIRGAKGNSDGMGLVAALPTGMMRYRTLDDFDTFYNVYKKYEMYPMLIHFRIRTAGMVIEENCHPFHIKDNLFMIHNGGFYNYDDTYNVKSDTRLVAEALAKLPHIERLLTDSSSALFKQVEDIIGSQKVVMLDKDFHHIFNEKYGFWQEGCWWSNSSGVGWENKVKDIEEEDDYIGHGACMLPPWSSSHRGFSVD